MFCYCCSGKTFTECCAPYLLQHQVAINCEALMRSRYSAYCMANSTYLVDTLHPSQHSAHSKDEITAFANSVHFCRLQIKAAHQTADRGQVSFAAYFLHGQKLDVIEEVSDFVLLDRWYYHSGKLTAAEPTKIGRNDSCPCGSGKKFKQCLVHQPSGQIIT